MKKRTAKILKWFGIVVIALAVLHVVLLIAADHSLKKAYAELEAEGRPMSAEDIIPERIPDEDNAALLYKAAILKLKAEKAGNTNLWIALSEKAEKVLSEKAAEDNLKDFRELADNKIVAEALALVEQGTRKSGCRYDLDHIDHPIRLSISHAIDLHKLSKILCATVLVRSEDSNFDVAWNHAVTALRLADALKNEPILVSQLVRSAQLKAVITSIQRLPFSSAQYQEVDALLKGFDDTAPFALAMDAERLIGGEWGFRQMCSGADLSGLDHISPEFRFARIVYSTALTRPMLKLDHAAYLRIMNSVARSMSEPYFRASNQVEREIAEIPVYCIFNRMALGSIFKAAEKQSLMLARSRITRAGLAVLKHQAENGKWPENIPIQEKLLDPFSEKPLIYKPTENGFVLSGIGQSEDSEKRIPAKDRAGISWEYSK